MAREPKAERAAQAPEDMAPPPEGLPPEPPRDPAEPDVPDEETKVSVPAETKGGLPPAGHVLVTHPDGRTEILDATRPWWRGRRPPQSTFRSRAEALARKAS